MTAKEWGGNVDNRTVRTGLTKIGQLSSGCTATFIGGPENSGQYFVITAAHCLWDGYGNYLDPSFAPPPAISVPAPTAPGTAGNG